MPKALSKTQKRLDNSIRTVLNDLCENTLKDYDGFEWVTHQANYSNFPASLIITCVFEDQTKQLALEQSGNDAEIRSILQRALFKIGVKVPAPLFQIRWDNEEDCLTQHQGNWKVRLQGKAGLAVAKNRPTSH